MLEKLHPGQTVEAPTPPQFKFVYVIHHELESASETWEMVKDCDIVLREETGSTEEERVKVEKMIALATYKPESATGSALRNLFLSEREKGWGSSIIANAIEAGKEFHYIDALDGSPAIKMLRDAEILFRGSFTLLWLGQPLDGVEFLEKSVEKFALSNRLRTETVLVQIRQLIEQRGKRWNGKRIGIVQGAAHEPAFETFKANFPGYEAEKEVMNSFSPVLLGTIMEKELFPDKKVDQNNLVKIMLSEGIIRTYLGVTKPKKDDVTMCRLADKIVAELTPWEIDQYWQTIIESDGKRNGSFERLWKMAGIICLKYELKKPGLNS